MAWQVAPAREVRAGASTATNPLLGDVLVVLAQLLAATQFIVEEKYLAKCGAGAANLAVMPCSTNEFVHMFWSPFAGVPLLILVAVFQSCHGIIGTSSLLCPGTCPGGCRGPRKGSLMDGGFVCP